MLSSRKGIRGSTLQDAREIKIGVCVCVVCVCVNNFHYNNDAKSQ